jgi:cellulose synthase/poly-beta-1,6-N-acetylglucosamine synthase-like glycosyltransferase
MNQLEMTGSVGKSSDAGADSWKPAGDTPFVSIVIPALNCAHEVDACIAGLRAQDYPADRFEIVVADNGSTDGTPEKLEKLGVKVVSQPQRGRSRALNAGLAAARGEIILTTDMSCVARPDWIGKVVACFADPDVGCVAGEIGMIPSGDNLALRYQARNGYMSPLHALSRRRLPFLPFADGANASFRRAVFDAIGGFEDSFFKAADVEICYRLLVLTDWKIAFCPDCVVEETGEPDLRALLRQRYRMGMGTHLLRARFPQFYETAGADRSLRQRYWSARESLANVARLGAATFRLDRAVLEDALVGYLMTKAQRWGYRRGADHLRRQAQQPSPLDAARLRQFMARMDRLDERVVLRRLQDAPTVPQA